MNRDKWLRLVREELPDQRYQHTIRVVDTAMELAKRFGADIRKAELAAILHDYAKNWSGEQMKEIMKNDVEAKEVLNFAPPLWHAHAGALAAKIKLGVDDEHVLQAIRYHTSGRKGMSILEKVVWLADYIEPGRSFLGVDPVRELATKDINAAMIQALSNSMQHLLKKHRPVYPLTLEAYNDLLENQKERD